MRLENLFGGVVRPDCLTSLCRHRLVKVEHPGNESGLADINGDAGYATLVTWEANQGKTDYRVRLPPLTGSRMVIFRGLVVCVMLDKIWTI